jgi:hypothetical protein
MAAARSRGFGYDASRSGRRPSQSDPMSTDAAIRTAVVFVHGLLERRPMDTFDTFAKSVLSPQGGEWEYHPQPLEVTDSYEARRYVAPSAGIELFEYDWSFLMTSTRYAGFVPALARVFLRRPRNVPDQLFGIWRLTWLALLVPVALLVGVLVVGGFLLHTGVAGWIVGVVSSVVVLTIGFGVLRTAPRALNRSFLTTGFVNVARYFDPAPESSDSRHELFDRLIRRGVVVCCPPRTDGSEVDPSQSPFAVTRWTNIWFPVRRGGIRGDWFGGVLQPLFGPGIREIAVTGNRPERLRPGAAQTKYFTRPDHDADGEVAFHLRQILALADDAGLQASITAPPPDPLTVSRTVYRSWQRSM